MWWILAVREPTAVFGCIRKATSGFSRPGRVSAISPSNLTVIASLNPPKCNASGGQSPKPRPRRPARGGACRSTARPNTAGRTYQEEKDLNNDDNSENNRIGDNRPPFGVFSRAGAGQSTGADECGLGGQREHVQCHALGARPADGTSLDPTGRSGGGRCHKSARGIQRD